MMLQGYHCQKVQWGSFSKNCDGPCIWGTERVLFIDVFPKGHSISLEDCTHLLTNLKYAAKWKSGEN